MLKDDTVEELTGKSSRNSEHQESERELISDVVV